MVFGVAEPAQGNTELNGDGDTSDFVVHVIHFDPDEEPTPEEAIEALIDEIDQLEADEVLNRGQANSLRVKLEAALRSLERGNTRAAVNQLRAFVNQVNALIRGGVLTADQGQPLIDAAEAIIDEL